MPTWSGVSCNDNGNFVAIVLEVGTNGKLPSTKMNSRAWPRCSSSCSDWLGGSSWELCDGVVPSEAFCASSGKAAANKNVAIRQPKASFFMIMCTWLVGTPDHRRRAVMNRPGGALLESA